MPHMGIGLVVAQRSFETTAPEEVVVAAETEPAVAAAAQPSAAGEAGDPAKREKRSVLQYSHQ